MHHLQTLHERLCSLRDHRPQDTTLGICQVLGAPPSDDAQIRLADDGALEAAFKTWPEFSGDPTFPVPHATMDADDAFFSITNIWEGEYGGARRSLLDHCIAEIERQLPAIEAQTRVTNGRQPATSP